MTESGATRVAVYLDFDNIVISRYDQVNGRNSFQRDKAKGLDEYPDRLKRATVDVGASSTSPRPSARWCSPARTPTGRPTSTPAYRGQLVGRAVDLVQLFPAAAYGKNGADIRLAVDAVEDMFRLPDLTHVVIVAGDSDYIALAQRCKRLGRYVVGIGVAGSSSRIAGRGVRRVRHLRRAARHPGVRADAPAADGRRPRRDDEPGGPSARAGLRGRPEEPDPPDPQAAATGLLTRALRIGLEKDDADWLHNSAVKAQMKRMDPSFSEKSLGFRSFSDFLRSRSDVVELDESSTTRMVRLRDKT